MKTIGFHVQELQKHQATPWRDEYSADTTIFGKKTFVPIDFENTKNENVLVLGSSGTGKTYSFVEPNILQANANYVIADAKGDILNNIGASLKKQGYQIQILNLIDLKHSMTYNPFVYLNSEISVMSFADEILSNDGKRAGTTSQSDDPFWHTGPMAILQALILWVKEFLPLEEQNMGAVCRLFNMLGQFDDNINNILTSLGASANEPAYKFYSSTDDNKYMEMKDRLFGFAREVKPNSRALKAWDSIAGTGESEKTWASLIGILGAALARYQIDDVENLMASNQLDFSNLLKPKTALFILYDDSDPSKNFISDILYSQLFSYLYHYAFKQKAKRLPVKIRFFLDDFKNIRIPHFDDYLATARSRNISICMMLQDESQLLAKFGANTPSVIGNCSAYLLTGTTDLIMARKAAERFGKTSKLIRLMSNEKFLLDLGGYTTTIKRYDFHSHPNYINQPFDFLKKIQTPKITNDWKGFRDVLHNLPDEYELTFDDETEADDDTILFD